MSEDAAPNTQDRVFRLIDYREKCPDCAVAVGEEHEFDSYDGGCDKAICLKTGLPTADLDLDHDHGRDKWTGWPPGMAECEEYGWMLVPGWPGIPRLYTEAVWDPEQGRWVKPTYPAAPTVLGGPRPAAPSMRRKAPAASICHLATRWGLAP